MAQTHTAIIGDARKAFTSGKTKPIEWRRCQLLQLIKFLDENTNEICQAVKSDLNKDILECEIMEISGVRNEACIAVKNLKMLSQRHYVEKSMLAIFNKVYYTYEPLGVCIVSAPWNYPVRVLLQPVVGAIATGNCVVIKPSEHAPKTAEVMKKLLPQYIDSVCYPVIVCDAIESANLFKDNKFDHITYTGSSGVAKLIMSAASKHLTPLLFELGGSNACFVHQSCDLRSTARRITSAKFSNAGQLCVTANHIFCHRSICDELVDLIGSSLKEFYGEDPQKSNHYARIINNQHFNRLVKLLDGQTTIVIGSEFDEKDKYIAPTVLCDVSMNSSLISDEIFGPILPIVVVDDFDEALEHTNHTPKSLQLAVFANDKKFIDHIRDNTQSGGMTVNDLILQNNELTLPFGGVGESGMGCYAGKYTLEVYSQKRSHYEGNTSEYIHSLLRYPPYKKWQAWILRRMIFLPDFTMRDFTFFKYIVLAVLVSILIKVVV